MATIVIHYIAPTLLISYVLFLFFLINELNSSFEFKTDKTEYVNGLEITDPKSDYIRKSKILSDKEVKKMFKNQHQNILYLNKSIDSLQKQIIRVNNLHSKSNVKLSTHLNNVHSQLITIIFHVMILALSLILLYIAKNFC